MLASSIDSLAMITKGINTAGTNALNLLCSSDIANLADYYRTIKDFELGSINLFAGSIGYADNDIFHRLSQVNYHAVNFSLSVAEVDLTAIASAIKASNIAFINCNYSFEDKTIKNAVLPYLIIYSGKTKIGITGIGANTNTPGIVVKEPVLSLNRIAKYLKMKQNCDKVICLADLGFDKKKKLNNLTLAQNSANVDMVVGAGTNPRQVTAWSYRNIEKQEVLVSANKSTHRFTNLIQLATNQNKQIFNTKNI